MPPTREGVPFNANLLDESLLLATQEQENRRVFNTNAPSLDINSKCGHDVGNSIIRVFLVGNSAPVAASHSPRPTWASLHPSTLAGVIKVAPSESCNATHFISYSGSARGGSDALDKIISLLDADGGTSGAKRYSYSLGMLPSSTSQVYAV